MKTSIKAPLKSIAATLIASLMIAGALPASAHSTAQQHSQPAAHQQKLNQNKNHKQDQRTQAQKHHAASQKANNKSRHPAPPKHWKKSNSAWQAHVDRCQKNYRSYNAKTDHYTMKGGKTAICRL